MANDVTMDEISGAISWADSHEVLGIPITREETSEMHADGWFNITHDYGVENAIYTVVIFLFDEDGGETRTEVYVEISRGVMEVTGYEEVYRLNDPYLPPETESS